jgi:SAM-dependent methyltransferase
MSADSTREGWHGWDQYAPFYDWENARTLGRRDLPFWRSLTQGATGAVLELGCGTGRLSAPLAANGVELVGIDRSAVMLSRLRAQLCRQPAQSGGTGGPAERDRGTGAPGVKLVRGDIRALPFRDGTFAMVLAPYGVLQSLVRPRDLAENLASVRRVVAPGGVFGIDLVPDVLRWREYRNRVKMRGRHGAARLTLIESVRHDRRQRLTTFDERYVERRNGRAVEHRFHLTFRTLSVPEMSHELERAGFVVDDLVGDYSGRPWNPRAPVWIILAKKR